MAMRIESVREKASETLEVALSGGLLFRFDVKDAEQLGYFFDHGARMLGVAAESSPITLRKEEILNEGAVLALRRLDALHRARKDALSILSYAEQGSKQLYEKLLKRGYEPEISRACLTWVCNEHYVDDRRYVAMLLRSHMVRRGQGPDRIKAIAWPRIGLFEDPNTILADGLVSMTEEDMQEAIRRSCAAILRRTENFSRSGCGIGRRQRRSNGLKSNSLKSNGLPRGASEDEPDVGQHLMSFSEQCSLLRGYLKHEGFPSHSIDVFLESWGKDARGDD